MDINEECEFLNLIHPLDDLWTLYDGIFEQHPISGDQPNTTNADKEIDHISADIVVEQQQMETLVPLDKGSKKTKKISDISSNSKKRREVVRRNSSIIIGSKGKGRMCDGEGEQGQSSLVAKKMDHNARERIRRMNVNASYLALRALLPDSRRSKKRWSAPSIVDKVLKYIPELENQIEELAYKKEQMQSAPIKNMPTTTSRCQTSTPAVSINEVNQDEAIVQICMDGKDGSAFTNLLRRIEDEGIGINSASTLNVCENRTSSHLHIQMNRVSRGAEYIAELKDKIIYWLG